MNAIPASLEPDKNLKSEVLSPEEKSEGYRFFMRLWVLNKQSFPRAFSALGF
jgi:hypothetical protein